MKKTRQGILGYIFLFSLWIGLTIIVISPYGEYPPLNAIPHSIQQTPDYKEMVLIPAGTFIMGSSNEEVEKVIKTYGNRGDFVEYDFKKEKPRRSVYVKAFYIDRYEVTNAQYKKFIDAADYPPPHHWHDGTFPPDKANHPVIDVNWSDAKAYAEWAGKRLPTEEEWEKAARGTDGRIYPWGDEFNQDKAGTAEGILRLYLTPTDLLHYAAPVDEFKGDKSPYGVYDMAGNVMEWTDSWYERTEKKAVKGASWVHLGARARSATTDGVNPERFSHLLGFRCAVDADKDIKTRRIESTL